MHEIFHVSPLSWEKRQEWETLHGHVRDYPHAMRGRHGFVKTPLMQLGALCCDASLQEVWSIVPSPDRALRHLAFKLAARCASSLFEGILLPELAHPYTYLTLDHADDPMAAAGELCHNMPRCTMDCFTLEALAAYPTPEALLSGAARAERQALLTSAKICISRIESRHAAIRRLCKLSGLQSKAPEFAAVSSMFVLSACNKHIASESTSQLGGKVAKVAKKQSVSGWNAYVHERTRGKSFQADEWRVTSKQLANEWKGLSAEQRRPYQQWAQCANQRLAAQLAPFPSSRQDSKHEEGRKAAEEAETWAEALQQGNLNIHPERPWASSCEAHLEGMRSKLRAAAIACSKRVRDEEQERSADLARFASSVPVQEVDGVELEKLRREFGICEGP